ncbi:hypothetical protein VNI00_012919 [Paramarasmius palmivorus]|uniref:Uncharacterized protein n=1 Tax=Paramarasmius palmivorus TaxID=297713 RepID=A0AAW0C1H2_9AGAR
MPYVGPHLRLEEEAGIIVADDAKDHIYFIGKVIGQRSSKNDPRRRTRFVPGSGSDITVKSAPVILPSSSSSLPTMHALR